MRALTWRGETTIGEDYAVEEIPADMVDAAQAAHHALIEQVADYDDVLMEAYLTDESAIDAELLEAAVRRAVLSSQITAVLCGSAFKNKGVQPLLDAVIAYLPAPVDVRPSTASSRGTRRSRSSGSRTTPTRSRHSPSRSRPTRTWAG